MKDNTIVAIATAKGESAIGIIKMSGENSTNILKEIFITKNKNRKLKFEDKMLNYGYIYDKNNDEIIDEVLVSVMLGPKSYTAEDVVEINCHGGLIPLQRILDLLLEKGAELAEPGEFTKRAFLNGRLDLAQAESVMDLISAKTEKGFELALDQLEGSLTKEIKKLRDEIVEVIAELQVSIDYPEEDIEEITYPQVLSACNNIKDSIENKIKSSEKGKIIREGLNTVIVGKPNVGKSSLMNALLNESKAIVTDVPGTTRDVIEEYININGIPLKIVDTAGIRETKDVVEKIGVERSKQFFNNADLVICVLNYGEQLSDEDKEIIKYLTDKKTIVVLNKVDLEQKIEMDYINNTLHDKVIIKTSAINKKGIHLIEEEIEKMVLGGSVTKDESSLITNTRHKNALKKAYQSITDAINAIDSHLSYDFIEVDLNDVYDYLGEITGQTVEEDIIDKIFSNFCLGK